MDGHEMGPGENDKGADAQQVQTLNARRLQSGRRYMDSLYTSTRLSRKFLVSPRARPAGVFASTAQVILARRTQ